jgi:hypothetical protein
MTRPGDAGTGHENTVAVADRLYTRDEVIEYMTQALRWGHEALADEENAVWPDTEIVFNAGETIKALERKRYREECDAARPAAAYTGGPVDWDTGKPRKPPEGGGYSEQPPEPRYVRYRFPTLDEQSAWLTPEDVAFCRRYAREHR